MPRMYCSHVAYCTTLNVQTLTTSRLPKRFWQSVVKLNLIILDVPTFTTSRLPRDPSSQRWNMWARNARLPHSIQESFTCRKSTTWDRRLYLPSEGRRAEDFFAWKIRRLRPGLNLGTKDQHATSRPPKPLNSGLVYSCTGVTPWLTSCYLRLSWLMATMHLFTFRS